jgi:hypothetical protein
MRRSLLVAAALVLVAPLAPRTVRAQAVVTDEERQAARNLYFEGVKLQDEGKFTDALDRFTRAQRIFSAPTHVLHMAECQAAIGKLVESAESYRALIKADLGKSPPPAFVQAQQQAVAELPAVEARIPTLKVDVLPANVQNAQMTVNGQPINAALIGVARPVNPGNHLVAVSAPGYAKAEQQVAVAEKEKRVISLTLQPGGVVYGAPTIPIYTVPAQGNPQGAQGNPQQQPDRPPEYKPDDTPKPSSAGLILGVEAGASVPAGELAKRNLVQPIKLSDRASPGFGFGLDGAFRVATKMLIGATWQFAGFGQSDAVRNDFGTGDNVTTSQFANYLGARVGFVSNPDATGFYGTLGVGYRWFTQKTTVTGGANIERSDTYGGVDFELAMGVWIRAAQWLRLVPKVSASVGSFSENNCTGTSCSTALQSYLGPGAIQSDNRGTHVFVFVGIGGYYNLDFGKK